MFVALILYCFRAISFKNIIEVIESDGRAKAYIKYV